MAFVYEVSRPPLFNPKKATAEIGPGQYIPLTLYKFEKPNIVPFNASSKRGNLFRIHPNPGPGAYNPKEEQNISYQIKQNKRNNDIYNNINLNKSNSFQIIGNKVKMIHKKSQEIEKYENKENYGFFTKVGRFNDYNKLNTPGPGTYGDINYLKAKSIEEKCYNKKEIIYRTNKERLDVYSVNRFDRQFPWNSEVIKPKKKKKKNIKLKNHKLKNLNENENKELVISKLNKDKKSKSDGNANTVIGINNYDVNNLNNDINKNSEEKKINQKVKDKNSVTHMIHKKNEEQKYKKLSILRKSKTSTNFYMQEKNKEGKNIINNNINNNDFKANKNTKLSKKEIKEILNQEMKLNQQRNDIKYRISSIPSKFTAGYELEKSSGKIVRKPLITNFKIFSGEKNDAVGPGSYEINLPKEWRKTGTSWSKYLVKKDTNKIRPKSGLSNNNDYKNIINYNKLDKTFKKIVKSKSQNNELNNINYNTPNLYKFYSTQHIVFHPKNYNIRLINEQITKDKLPEFIPVNDVPGPGYYYDEEKNNFNFKNKKNDTTKLKTAHLYEDFQIENNLDDGGLGPGTYFNDILNLYNTNKNNKNKKGISSEKKIIKTIPFLCTSKRFSYDIPQNDNTGNIYKSEQIINELKKIVSSDISLESGNTSNSTHNLGFSLQDKIFDNENNFMSKTFSSKMGKFKPLNGTFYRRDMRFRENFQEENMKKEIPGPGTYINPYTSTGKTNTIKIDGRYMDIRSCRVLIEKDRENKFKKNKKIDEKLIPWMSGGVWGTGGSHGPPVGTYEPDKTLTILYDVNKHKKYGNNHFNSTQFSDRNGFYFYQKNAPNGPGCYFNDKHVETKQNSAAFNSTADRFFKGGKNNTRTIIEMTKKLVDISVKKNKDGESLLGLKEKVIENQFNEDKRIDNRSSTPNIVGPGSYHFLPEVYPWVKQSYNTKFN